MDNGPQPLPHDPTAITQALARADLFGFLAALLNEVPDLELVRQLRTTGVESFQPSPEDEDANPAVGQALEEIRVFVEATREQPAADVQQTLAIDWTRLFRGVTPGYGPTPPYEGLFGDGTRTHLQVLQAIQSIYVENGAIVTESIHNRPDYLGLELDFVGFLADREAEAWAAGESEAAVDFAARAEAFLAEHPARWAPVFIQEALSKAQTDFYRGLLRLIQALLAEAAVTAAA